MSCFNCAARFNWRRKELECRNCQKAVCKQCLNQKLLIPKFGPKETLVCMKCFNDYKKTKNTSSHGSGSGGREPPPSYDEPAQYFGPSMKDIVTSKTSKTQPQTDPDVELRVRLDQLKEKPKSVSNNELEEKFQSVAGRSAASSSSSGNNILTPQPKLTETEEVKKLLEQTNAEINIDNTYAEDLHEKVDDMEKRLLKLQGIDPEKVERKPIEYLNSSSEDECDAIKKIISKCSLVPLDQPGKPSTSSSTSQTQRDNEEEEELPWCCICNDDATVRCQDCDDDLYCKRCFRECHNDYDTKGHVNSSYKGKPSR